MLIYVVCPLESELEVTVLSTDYKTLEESGSADLFMFLFFSCCLSADTYTPDMFCPCFLSLTIMSLLPEGRVV